MTTQKLQMCSASLFQISIRVSLYTGSLRIYIYNILHYRENTVNQNLLSYSTITIFSLNVIYAVPLNIKKGNLFTKSVTFHWGTGLGLISLKVNNATLIFLGPVTYT